MGSTNMPHTAFDRARLMCRRALELRDPEERQQLARRALMITDEVPEAYTILAQHAPTADEALGLFRKALTRADNLVGSSALQNPDGRLFEVSDGVSYLVARDGLALCLARTGQKEASCAHFEAMLELDAGDNLGASHSLLGLLTELGTPTGPEGTPETPEAHTPVGTLHKVRGIRENDYTVEDPNLRAWDLTEEHPCDCNQHLYSRALVAFRLYKADRTKDPSGEASSRAATELLKEALLSYPETPMFLTGMRPMPGELPPPEQLVEEEWTTDLIYATAAQEAWRGTPGALEWMRETMAEITTELQKRLEDAGITEEELLQAFTNALHEAVRTEYNGHNGHDQGEGTFGSTIGAEDLFDDPYENLPRPLSYEQAFLHAHEMVWSLYEHPDGDDPELREHRARAALELCRDCADAYRTLGQIEEEYNDPERARELYENGVAAGERALKKLRGPDIFKKDRGEFFGIVESRPYIGVRGALADVLWELGEHDAALEHAREVMRLNKMDNLGLRYTVADWLYRLERFDELDKHLRKHHAFSKDWGLHDSGFKEKVPHVLPERYWREFRNF